MFKKMFFYLALLPLLAAFPFYSCAGSEDEIGPKTKLTVTVTYTGDLIQPGISEIGLGLYRTDDLSDQGGYMMPSGPPCSMGYNYSPEKNVPYDVELTSIPVTEAYLFIFLNVDSDLVMPETGDPFVFYNGKSGEIGVSDLIESDILTLIEDGENSVSVTFGDTYTY